MTDVSIPSAAEPAAPRATEAQTAHIPPSAVQSGDHCPSCGAPMAVDQRYCLECGQRRGDPRLPFMDAVVLMEAVRQPRQGPPPPPKKKRDGISPNAALIAGVGTLLLALGVGVLIGRSGTHDSASTAPAAPIVIHGGGEEASTAAAKEGTSTGGGGAKAKTKKQKKAALNEAEANPGSEEVLKPKSGVKLAPPKTQVGGKCEEGTAGCEHGKFEGTFFK